MAERYSSKQVATTQVLVASAATTPVLAANPLRRRALIKNIGGTNFAWMLNSTVLGTASSSTGHKIALNETVEILNQGAVSARADTADVTFTVIEEFD